MTTPLCRRSFLKYLAGGAATLAGSYPARSADEPSNKQTYTYKTADNCPIKADVHGASQEKAKPVVVWIHGGALMLAHRGKIHAQFLELLLGAGYVVVSIDYRLAPEAKLPAILDDLRDACQWVRTKGPKLFHADPDRLAVTGASAGGYLTLAAGFRVEPPPKALVAFWGYGDIAGPWLSQPDPFYRRRPPVEKEDALRTVGGPVLSETGDKSERSRFYLYCRQRGLWPLEATGHDPVKEPRAFDPLCPIRNISKKYPPTLLIHGTRDADVPHEQSTLMAKALAEKEVEHALISIPNGGHGFDEMEPAVLTKTLERVRGFLDKHLQ